MKNFKGKLLVAQPTILNDSIFNRSTIILAEHTTNNAVGFIINRPLDIRLKDLLPEIDCDFTLFDGGPVEQDNLYFIHKIPELLPESTAISDDLYWGGNFEVLKLLLNTKTITTTDIRFFLGYSGWGKNQLDSEIKSSSWFVSDANIDELFNTDVSHIWRNQIIKKGGSYQLWANAPSDVNLN